MIFSAIVVGLLWGVTVLRVPVLWRGRRRRALWGAVGALALTKTASFPPVAAWLGLPVLPHLFGVLAAFCVLHFISLATGARRRSSEIVVTAAVLIALAALDAAAGGIHTSADVLAAPLTPAEVGYWVVLECYLAAVLVTAAVLFWTVGRAAPAGLPRLGLRAVAAGSLLISLYAVTKATLLVVHKCGVPVPFESIEPVAHVGQTIAVLVAVAGGTIPALRGARPVVTAYRSLVALRPLWRAMHDAFPQVILFSPRRALIELAGIDDVHLRLYRRVIEIRDGMLALRDYLPESVPPAADPAITEADGIALALARHAAGEPATRPGTWAPVGPQMADEVAWLTRVSRAFRARTPRPCGSAR